MSRVLIIGAGIGGLCAAIGLRQAGFEVEVYERARVLGEVGAGLTLWANALRGLRQLGLADTMIQAGARLDRAAILDAQGKILTQTQTGNFERWYGEPTIAIHRASLHHRLLVALPEEIIHLGMECIRVEQDADGVTACFATGEKACADLLVGADGIHSGIRQGLFPQTHLRYAGYTAWRGVTAAEPAGVEETMPLGLSSESWGCGRRFGIVRLAGDQVYWFATQNTPAGQALTGEESRKLLLELFAGWHAPIAALIGQTPPEGILHNDILDFEPLASWSQGRVTLLGDAAHATTPNMGQGACQAIESAVALAHSLKEAPDYQAAFQLYEAGRKARTAWITHQSWQIGVIGQLENQWLCRLRNWTMRLVPANLIQARFRQAIGAR